MSKKIPNHQLPNVSPTSVEDVVTELTRRGYETPMINGYAKASLSWCAIGSPEREVWAQVVELTCERSASKG